MTSSYRTKEVEDEFILTDPRFEQISAAERRKAAAKSAGFKTLYKVSTGHKSKGLSFF